MRSRRLSTTTLAILALFVAALLLYVFTLVPGAASGDSGEFQYMPHVLGLAHPPGFPLYLLLGKLWSELPLGTLAWRMNFLSALFAAGTIALLFALARQQGFRPVAALGGALALALAPGFWRYATVAEVYSLNTLLIVLALWLWWRWTDLPTGAAHRERWLCAAASVTGLGLANHPTFFFLLPAVLLLLLLQKAWQQHRVRVLLLAALCFALPGLLYLYVPLRLFQLDSGARPFGLNEAIAHGLMSPFIQREWGWGGVGHYILDRSYTQGLTPDWEQLVVALPSVMVAELGLPFLLVAVLGALFWLWQRPRSFLPLLVLFLLCATYGLTVLARIASLSEVLDPAATLLPAVVVATLWLAQGVEAVSVGTSHLLRHRASVGRLMAMASGLFIIGAGLLWHPVRAGLPVAAAQEESTNITRYWQEVLAYPLEEDAALTGHWGDLTPFWYFQHGEGRRADLWAIFPPNLPQIEPWLAGSGRPVYLAGPLLGWEPSLADRYDLTPWGILVRIAPRDAPYERPPLTGNGTVVGEGLRLEGHRVLAPTREHWQVWLGWQTRGPVSRDLAVSLRLHGPDDAVLRQQDTRLASLWYPDATLPAELFFWTVFDITVPEPLPPNAVLRLVVYDPVSGQPLLTPKGEQVVEVGPLDEGKPE